ncbi:hypothetical protein SISNIDRAFT_486586 [Sistotremastrum niveocremeum HHB9708]|uniref:TFIIS N-terminal domain-containing protein n=2 Tax=Sistotremastraceae TaxID=3402574 RepID=A0A164TQX3_9AGAM|nr:hypothetical protein SISNIDRAFT_486586 [Sistotremastrum niveocremeum HHB9708]KZT42235.1 hypothetical protein SISSUDRAFT_1058835 [Sistotremastrum suecicum HHB10207 ss-3]
MPQDLEREVFGGSDSELSEEEDIPQRRKSPIARHDADESSGESGDEYVQEKRVVKKSKKSRAKRPDDQPGERRPPSKKRKRKPAVTQEELDALPPELARKAQLDLQIESILKTKKASRPKKRKKDAEEEVIDRFADEEVQRLRENMIAAADDDIQANKDKLPATSKLKMLPQVMDVLQKSALTQSIIDNNLLEGVRRWLEPLPDKSLPALNIQNAFFEAMTKMYIDTNTLKESGLGRIVLFYTKCKRVTGHVNKLANDLVSAWSRPIIKRSASYRDRQIPLAENEGDAPRQNDRLNMILERARKSEKNRVRKNAVSIPTSSLGTYSVAPRPGVAPANVSVEADVERRRKNAQRLRNFTKQMHGSKAR